MPFLTERENVTHDEKRVHATREKLPPWLEHHLHCLEVGARFPSLRSRPSAAGVHADRGRVKLPRQRVSHGPDSGRLGTAHPRCVEQPAQRVGRTQEHIRNAWREPVVTVSKSVEKAFEGVREARKGLEPEHPRAALDRMRRAEDRVHELRIIRTRFESEKRLLHGGNVLSCLLEERRLVSTQVFLTKRHGTFAPRLPCAARSWRLFARARGGPRSARLVDEREFRLEAGEPQCSGDGVRWIAQSCLEIQAPKLLREREHDLKPGGVEALDGRALDRNRRATRRAGSRGIEEHTHTRDVQGATQSKGSRTLAAV